jgi:hypothetical protein
MDSLISREKGQKKKKRDKKSRGYDAINAA